MEDTVLIIEDDLESARLVRLYLERDGRQVLEAHDGMEGLHLAQEARPALIVLDLMLPRLDGLDICRELRKTSSVPIIMVTARVDEEERLAGLEAGADDYVTKPFSPRELAARVKAVLRRSARDQGLWEEGPAELRYGDLTVDLTNRLVHRDGAPVRVTPTEFRLLTLFMREPNRTFTRDELIDRAFGYDFDGFDRSVDMHISNLRRKLAEGNGHLKYIQTVYGVGYRLAVL